MFTEQQLQIIRLIFKEEIDNALSNLIKSDRYLFNKTIEIAPGRDIQVGTTNGTKIGTASTQKLSVFGVDPIVQKAAIASPAGGSTVDTQARLAIDYLREAVRDFGITA